MMSATIPRTLSIRVVSARRGQKLLPHWRGSQSGADFHFVCDGRRHLAGDRATVILARSTVRWRVRLPPNAVGGVDGAAPRSAMIANDRSAISVICKRYCSQALGGRKRISPSPGNRFSPMPNRCNCRQSKSGLMMSASLTGMLDTSAPLMRRHASRAASCLSDSSRIPGVSVPPAPTNAPYRR